MKNQLKNGLVKIVLILKYHLVLEDYGISNNNQMKIPINNLWKKILNKNEKIYVIMKMIKLNKNWFQISMFFLKQLKILILKAL